jgi:hypothetical protein
VYQKALSDSDACVRAAAARCLASLARQGLLRSAKLRDGVRRRRAAAGADPSRSCAAPPRS